MEALRGFLTPEMIALMMVFVGCIVIIVAVSTANKIGSLSSSIDEFRSDVEQSLDRKIGDVSVAIPKEINRVFGQIEHQLSVLSDSSRDNLTKTITEIIKVVNDFRNEQVKADAERHEGLQKKFTDQSLHLQDRLHNITKENSESFNALHERMRKVVETGMSAARSDMAEKLSSLSKEVQTSMDGLVGMVGTRLNERFEKANESMENLTSRLNAIDSAQRNIQELSSDVVNLTRVVADKRARGAMGEIQLTHLVGDMLSKDHYETDVTLPSGARAPVLLRLPEPTGSVAVSAGLSLENYAQINEVDGDPSTARDAFSQDVLRAIESAAECIDPPHTSNGALLFVPSESAFSELHLHHRSLVEEAYSRNVWIVSPTTMMALLNMARSVIKDVATRQEARRIRDELVRFGEDFKRFNRLVENLAENISEANKEVLKAQSESQLISDRLTAIGQTADLKMVGTKSQGEQ